MHEHVNYKYRDMLLHILTQILSSILQANISYHCLPWYQLEK